MSYFAYIRRKGSWMVPKLEPQIIHDEGIMTYLINSPNHQAQPEVVAKWPLTEAQASLSIAELESLFPCPTVQ